MSTDELSLKLATNILLYSEVLLWMRGRVKGVTHACLMVHRYKLWVKLYVRSKWYCTYKVNTVSLYCTH
jgi:hypothetical protein